MATNTSLAFFESPMCFQWIAKWLPKTVLVTGIIWAVIRATMSIIFRLQLGFPGEILPGWNHFRQMDRSRCRGVENLVGLGSLPCRDHHCILYWQLDEAGTFQPSRHLQIGTETQRRHSKYLSYWFFSRMVNGNSLFWPGSTSPDGCIRHSVHCRRASSGRYGHDAVAG